MTAQELFDQCKQAAATIVATVKAQYPGSDGIYACCQKAKDPPPAPDLGKASQDSISGAIDALPVQKLIEAAARGGKRVSYTDPFTGEAKVADFTGFGDVDMARDDLAFELESAEARAESSLAISEQFGERYIAQRLKELEASDPEGFRIRKEMAKSILEEGFGTDLSDEMTKQVQQQARAAQAARGNILGVAPAAVEAMSVGEAGQRMRQQRLANAAALINGQTPVAQFQSLTGAQGGAAPFAPAQIQPGIGLNANQGTIGQQMALSSWGQTSQNWAQMQNFRVNNPWQKMLANVTGKMLTAPIDIASSAAGSAMGALCWVARAVYGFENPRWLRFRRWLMFKAPVWLLRFYNRYGERFARWLNKEPDCLVRAGIKRVLKYFMDKVTG